MKRIHTLLFFLVLALVLSLPAEADDFEAFMDAILKGDHDRVVRLIDRVDVNRSLRYGSLPLTYAADFGHYDIAKLLLDKGADPNGREYRQRTALHNACLQGHMDIIRLLIEHGAEVNSRNDMNFPPLESAICNSHYQVIKLLLEQGAEVNFKGGNTGTTTMHEAVFMGHPGIVKLLIEHGVDVNTRDNKGETPLMTAIDQHQFSCPGANRLNTARLLLSHGADVNAVDKKGRSALTIACTYGFEDAEKMLMEHGAEPVSTEDIKRKPTWASKTENLIASKLEATSAVRAKIREAMDFSKTGQYDQAIRIIEEIDRMPEAGEYRDCYKYIALVELLNEIRKKEEKQERMELVRKIVDMRRSLEKGYDRYLMIKLALLHARIEGPDKGTEIMSMVMKLLKDEKNPAKSDRLVSEIAVSLARMNEMERANKLLIKIGDPDLRSDTSGRIRKMDLLRSLAGEGEGVIILDGIFEGEEDADEDTIPIDVYFVDF